MAESGRGGQHSGSAPEEWSILWHHQALDVRGLHAYYVTRAFPRHSHDYYVIRLIEHGLQSFTHGGIKYLTTRFKRLLGVAPGQYAQRSPASRGVAHLPPTRRPSR